MSTYFIGLKWLRKSFDTVQHHTIIQKLHKTGLQQQH